MFNKAVKDLTVKYVLVLLLVIIGYSLIWYRLSLGRINSILKQFGPRIRDRVDLATELSAKLEDDKFNLIIDIIQFDSIVLILGGIGAYLLAKNTLNPINKAYESQKNYSANIAHQLKTPLAIMLSEAEVINNSKKPISKEVYNEYIKSNIEEINRLSSTTTKLLQLSSGKKTNKVKIPTSRLVKYINNRYPKRVKVSLDEWNISSDESVIQEILAIAIDNALKFSSDKVSIDGSKKGNKYSIKISDNGRGINDSELANIRKRYYQENNSVSGYGLGLSILEELCSRSNISYNIDSKIGVGTIVELLV